MDDGLPWQGYNSEKLHSGWVYPIRQRDVATALTDASARVRHVQRSVPVQGSQDTQLLIRATYSSGSRHRYFSNFVNENQADVYFYAVSSSQIDVAREHISHWLPLASDHEFTVFFSGAEAWVTEN